MIQDVPRLWLCEPRITVNRLAFVPLEMRSDHDGRVLHRVTVYVPQLQFTANAKQAAQRLRDIVDNAKTEIVQSYMATTRGLHE